MTEFIIMLISSCEGSFLGLDGPHEMSRIVLPPPICAVLEALLERPVWMHTPDAPEFADCIEAPACGVDAHVIVEDGGGSWLTLEL